MRASIRLREEAVPREVTESFVEGGAHELNAIGGLTMEQMDMVVDQCPTSRLKLEK